LNGLHDRITGTFLSYVPPEFYVEPVEERHLINYVSQREGLGPFVVGLLHGLANRFECKLTILSQSALEVDKGTHIVFEVLIEAS